MSPSLHGMSRSLRPLRTSSTTPPMTAPTSTPTTRTPPPPPSSPRPPPPPPPPPTPPPPLPPFLDGSPTPTARRPTPPPAPSVDSLDLGSEVALSDTLEEADFVPVPAITRHPEYPSTQYNLRVTD